MALEVALYRCRNAIFLATDEKVVSEHANHGLMRTSKVMKMPIGSVILHKNKPYDVEDLLKIKAKKAKTIKIDPERPFSIIVDDRFIT